MIRGALIGCLFACSGLACSSGDAPAGGVGTAGAAAGALGDAARGGQTTANAGSGGSGGATALGGTGPSPSAGSSSVAGQSTAGVGGAAGSPAAGAGSGGETSSGTGGQSSGGGGMATAGSGVGGAGMAAGGGGSMSCPVGGSGGQRPDPTPVKSLPNIPEMPDPLTMNDGTKVTTAEQWQARRLEMIALLEDYEYGRMPPPPCNVKATTVTESERVTVGSDEADYRMLHLTFGPDEKLGFDLGIFTPVTDTPGTRFPVLVSLTSSANDKSMGSASAAFARGYAVATVPYQQLGADATNWESTAFFPSYPDYDWRDFSAWAWGLSRAVDYLVTDTAIDPAKIMLTGVSRLGQAVLLAGALDERVALSAPVAGGSALRFSGQEMGMGLGQGITEIVDQNTYWFGPRFPEFRNQTPKLPSDQHWLLALTAPRLFIMCNSLSDQYGRAYAVVQTYQSAKPVFDFLGVSDNVGLSFREGTHGMTAEDWSALLDFSDQYLLKNGGTRKFDVIPPDDQLP